jgi:hypothetical protein
MFFYFLAVGYQWFFFFYFFFYFYIQLKSSFIFQNGVKTFSVIKNKKTFGFDITFFYNYFLIIKFFYTFLLKIILYFYQNIVSFISRPFYFLSVNFWFFVTFKFTNENLQIIKNNLIDFFLIKLAFFFGYSKLIILCFQQLKNYYQTLTYRFLFISLYFKLHLTLTYEILTVTKYLNKKKKTPSFFFSFDDYYFFFRSSFLFLYSSCFIRLQDLNISEYIEIGYPLTWLRQDQLLKTLYDNDSLFFWSLHSHFEKNIFFKLCEYKYLPTYLKTFEQSQTTPTPYLDLIVSSFNTNKNLPHIINEMYFSFHDSFRLTLFTELETDPFALLRLQLNHQMLNVKEQLISSNSHFLFEDYLYKPEILERICQFWYPYLLQSTINETILLNKTNQIFPLFRDFNFWSFSEWSHYWYVLYFELLTFFFIYALPFGQLLLVKEDFYAEHILLPYYTLIGDRFTNHFYFPVQLFYLITIFLFFKYALLPVHQDVYVYNDEYHKFRDFVWAVFRLDLIQHSVFLIFGMIMLIMPLYLNYVRNPDEARKIVLQNDSNYFNFILLQRKQFGNFVTTRLDDVDDSTQLLLDEISPINVLKMRLTNKDLNQNFKWPAIQVHEIAVYNKRNRGFKRRWERQRRRYHMFALELGLDFLEQSWLSRYPKTEIPRQHRRVRYTRMNRHYRIKFWEYFRQLRHYSRETFRETLGDTLQFKSWNAKRLTSRYNGNGYFGQRYKTSFFLGQITPDEVFELNGTTVLKHDDDVFMETLINQTYQKLFTTYFMKQVLALFTNYGYNDYLSPLLVPVVPKRSRRIITELEELKLAEIELKLKENLNKPLPALLDYPDFTKKHPWTLAKLRALTSNVTIALPKQESENLLKSDFHWLYGNLQRTNRRQPVIYKRDTYHVKQPLLKPKYHYSYRKTPDSISREIDLYEVWKFFRSYYYILFWDIGFFTSFFTFIKDCIMLWNRYSSMDFNLKETLTEPIYNQLFPIRYDGIEPFDKKYAVIRRKRRYYPDPKQKNLIDFFHRQAAATPDYFAVHYASITNFAKKWREFYRILNSDLYSYNARLWFTREFHQKYRQQNKYIKYVFRFFQSYLIRPTVNFYKYLRLTLHPRVLFHQSLLFSRYVFYESLFLVQQFRFYLFEISSIKFPIFLTIFQFIKDCFTTILTFGTNISILLCLFPIIQSQVEKKHPLSLDIWWCDPHFDQVNTEYFLNSSSLSTNKIYNYRFKLQQYPRAMPKLELTTTDWTVIYDRFLQHFYTPIYKQRRYTSKVLLLKKNKQKKLQLELTQVFLTKTQELKACVSENLYQEQMYNPDQIKQTFRSGYWWRYYQTPAFKNHPKARHYFKRYPFSVRENETDFFDNILDVRLSRSSQKSFRHSPIVRKTRLIFYDEMNMPDRIRRIPSNKKLILKKSLLYTYTYQPVTGTTSIFKKLSAQRIKELRQLTYEVNYPSSTLPGVFRVRRPINFTYPNPRNQVTGPRNGVLNNMPVSKFTFQIKSKRLSLSWQRQLYKTQFKFSNYLDIKDNPITFSLWPDMDFGIISSLFDHKKGLPSELVRNFFSGLYFYPFSSTIRTIPLHDRRDLLPRYRETRLRLSELADLSPVLPVTVRDTLAIAQAEKNPHLLETNSDFLRRYIRSNLLVFSLANMYSYVCGDISLQYRRPSLRFWVSASNDVYDLLKQKDRLGFMSSMNAPQGLEYYSDYQAKINQWYVRRSLFESFLNKKKYRVRHWAFMREDLRFWFRFIPRIINGQFWSNYFGRQSNSISPPNASPMTKYVHVSDILTTPTDIDTKVELLYSFLETKQLDETSNFLIDYFIADLTSSLRLLPRETMGLTDTYADVTGPGVIIQPFHLRYYLDPLKNEKNLAVKKYLMLQMLCSYLQNRPVMETYRQPVRVPLLKREKTFYDNVLQFSVYDHLSHAITLTDAESYTLKQLFGTVNDEADFVDMPELPIKIRKNPDVLHRPFKFKRDETFSKIYLQENYQSFRLLKNYISLHTQGSIRDQYEETSLTFSHYLESFEQIYLYSVNQVQIPELSQWIANLRRQLVWSYNQKDRFRVFYAYRPREAQKLLRVNNTLSYYKNNYIKHTIFSDISQFYTTKKYKFTKKLPIEILNSLKHINNLFTQAEIFPEKGELWRKKVQTLLCDQQPTVGLLDLRLHDFFSPAMLQKFYERQWEVLPEDEDFIFGYIRSTRELDDDTSWKALYKRLFKLAKTKRKFRHFKKEVAPTFKLEDQYEELFKLYTKFKRKKYLLYFYFMKNYTNSHISWSYFSFRREQSWQNRHAKLYHSMYFYRDLPWFPYEQDYRLPRQIKKNVVNFFYQRITDQFMVVDPYGASQVMKLLVIPGLNQHIPNLTGLLSEQIFPALKSFNDFIINPYYFVDYYKTETKPKTEWYTALKKEVVRLTNVFYGNLETIPEKEAEEIMNAFSDEHKQIFFMLEIARPPLNEKFRTINDSELLNSWLVGQNIRNHTENDFEHDINHDEAVFFNNLAFNVASREFSSIKYADAQYRNYNYNYSYFTKISNLTKFTFQQSDSRKLRINERRLARRYFKTTFDFLESAFDGNRHYTPSLSKFLLKYDMVFFTTRLQTNRHQKAVTSRFSTERGHNSFFFDGFSFPHAGRERRRGLESIFRNRRFVTLPRNTRVANDHPYFGQIDFDAKGFHPQPIVVYGRHQFIRAKIIRNNVPTHTQKDLAILSGFFNLNQLTPSFLVKLISGTTTTTPIDSYAVLSESTKGYLPYEWFDIYDPVAQKIVSPLPNGRFPFKRGLFLQRYVGYTHYPARNSLQQSYNPYNFHVTIQNLKQLSSGYVNLESHVGRQFTANQLLFQYYGVIPQTLFDFFFVSTYWGINWINLFYQSNIDIIDSHLNQLDYSHPNDGLLDFSNIRRVPLTTKQIISLENLNKPSLWMQVKQFFNTPITITRTESLFDLPSNASKLSNLSKENTSLMLTPLKKKS